MRLVEAGIAALRGAKYPFNILILFHNFKVGKIPGIEPRFCIALFKPPYRCRPARFAHVSRHCSRGATTLSAM
jgi:hypothetical protein